MEYEVSVDRQGRIVIPAPVRKLLGLSSGGRLLLVLRDGRIELIPIDRGLEERVNRWMELVLAIKSEPFSEEGVDSEWKWMDEKYVKRKLGLC
ncbi:MAG: hypothetical protein DRJ32_04840 [Thermoprotei archaeon]|nr:MAG: hypothetical protein DRJ32_04840 [Thermoprotei archaeon]